MNTYNNINIDMDNTITTWINVRDMYNMMTHTKQ